MRAVFTHKAASIYDDDPADRYHFPATYLRVAQAAIGDFILWPANCDLPRKLCLPVDRVGDHSAVVGIQFWTHEQDRNDAACHLDHEEHLVEAQRTTEQFLSGYESHFLIT